MDGVAGGDFALETRRDLRQICFARVLQVGPLLQVARILGGLALDQTRMRRRNHVRHRSARNKFPEQILHRPRVFIELGDMRGESRSLIEREWLVIRKERARAGDIGFRLPIGAAMNGVVRALEKKRFAIEHQLDAGVAEFRVQAAEAFAWKHDRSGDVVFHLHLVGRMKVRPQLVHAPRTILLVADAQVIVHELLIVELQFVSPDPVHAVDSEVLAPVFSPFRAVIALHREQQLAKSVGQAPQPGVVLVLIFGRRREELNHRAHGPFRAQNRPASSLVRRAVLVDARKICFEDFRHLIDVAVKVANEDRAFQDHVADRFRNFGLAAAGNGARLVAQRAAGPRAHQPPRGAAGLLFHSNAKAVGKHVGRVGAESETPRSVPDHPLDRAIANAELRIFRHVENIRIASIHRVAFRLNLNHRPQQAGRHR